MVEELSSAGTMGKDPDAGQVCRAESGIAGAGVVDGTGVVSHDEVLTHERQYLSDSSIARGASVLVDATGASFKAEPEAVHEVTDLYRRSIEQLRVGKAALLVNESIY